MASELSVSFIIGAALGGSFGSSFKAAQGYLEGVNKDVAALNKRQQELKAQQSSLNYALSEGSVEAETYRNKMMRLAASMHQVKGAQKAIALNNKLAIASENRRKSMVSAAEWGMMTYALAQPIQSAMKFQSAMSDVKKVVDMTGDEFKGMSQDIISMSQRIPMTAEEISKIVAAGGQAGIDKSELLGFAESAAKMGVAFDISAEQAGEMMSKWRTSFKMGQDEVIALSDKINHLGNTTAASADKISDVVTRIGPLGEVGGVASGEIAALGASMISTGVESEVAATGIKNLILGITAGEGATKTQSDAFAKLGLDAVEMSKKMQVDAKGAIIEVMTALNSVDKASQATLLKEMFGKESIGAIAPLLNNLDALKNNFEKVGNAIDYTGSMEAEYAERSKTAENAMKLFDNAVNGLSIQLGTSFLPVVTEGIQSVTNFVKGFTEFTANYPGLAQAIYGVVVGFTALMTVGSTIKAVYWGLRQGVILLKVAHLGFRMALLTLSIAMKSATVAQWLLNTALSANPISLVILAVGALIGVLWSLYSNWDEIKAFLISVWENPKAAIDTFVSFVRSKFSAVLDWLADKWNWVKSIFSEPIKASVEASASGNGKKIAANAKGGIYGKGAFLTTFAEESKEAAIPIDGSERAKGLWYKTGELLGISNGGSSVNATFAPSITINGNASAHDVEAVISDKMKEFERMLADLSNNQRRKSYA